MMSQAEATPSASADPFLPRRFRIARRTQETSDIFTIELTPEGEPSRLFAPGQFNMLYVFGVGEAAISIWGNSIKPDSVFHTVRAVGTVTQAMRGLKTGDSLGVRGPFGSAWPLAEAEGKDVLLIAGGLGVAPLRSALQHLVTHRERFARIALLYGARTPDVVLYQDELKPLERLGAARLDITVDRAQPGWRGKVGLVTQLIASTPFNPTNGIAMVCGPEVMMRFTVRELIARGLPDRAIFLSLERNMKCALGFCGHCQLGPEFICRDGPVFRYDRIKPWLYQREL